MSELDRKLVRGSAWLALSYGGGQLVSLLVTAVLAHLLAPAAFGLVALASVALVALGYLQESGLSAALIQRRTDVERAAGSVLVFSVVSALVLYGVAFALAPLAARALSQPRLTDVVRALGAILVLRGLGSVVGALIERELAFARRAKGELAGVLAQAATAITLAFLGFGVWSIVAGQLVGQLVQTSVYWAVAPLRPSPRLASWRMLRELSRYGRHITASNLVILVDGNIDTVLVGRLLGAASVGYYNLAWRLSNLPATGLSYVVGRVMFPAYATLQDDRDGFRAAFLTNLRRISILSLPVSLGIVLAADPIVVGIFGHRWAAAVEPLRILGVFGLVRSYAAATGAVFQAAGRPQLVFLISTAHLFVLAAALATLIPPLGISGAAAAMTIAAVASLVPSYVLALRILQLPLRDLLASIARPAASAAPATATLAVLVATTHGLTPVPRLALLAAATAATHLASLALLTRSELHTIAAAFRG